MTQSTVTIESLKDLSNDLQNQLDIVRANNKALYTCVEGQVLMISRLEKQRDELLEALEDVSEFLNFAWNDIEMNEYSFNLLEDVICKAQKAIAKAKGE